MKESVNRTGFTLIPKARNTIGPNQSNQSYGSFKTLMMSNMAKKKEVTSNILNFKNTWKT